MRPGLTWVQINIQLTSNEHAEDVLAGRLDEILGRAERAGGLAAWFFVRKQGWWRVRFRPTTDESLAGIRALLAATLRDLRRSMLVSEWVEVIYEPEIAAFGGSAAMGTAHRLFHHDSREILRCRAEIRLGRPDRRRELTMLLCSAMMRAARLEWYEQGDVWARVRANRPDEVKAPSAARLADMRRFLAVDTSVGGPVLSGELAYATHWFGGFEAAGDELGRMARQGTLTRGLRAVTAYHILFHWNRLGLPSTLQAALAEAARAAILGTPADERPLARAS